MEAETECLQNGEKMNAVSSHISQCHDTKVVESCPSFPIKMQKERSFWAACAVIRPSDRLHLNPSERPLFIRLSNSFILVVSLPGNRSHFFFTVQERSVPLSVSDCTDRWCKWSAAVYILRWQVICYTGSNNRSTLPQRNFEAPKSWLFPQALMATFLVPIVTWHGKIFQINDLKAPGLFRTTVRNPQQRAAFLFSFRSPSLISEVWLWQQKNPLSQY